VSTAAAAAAVPWVDEGSGDDDDDDDIFSVGEEDVDFLEEEDIKKASVRKDNAETAINVTVVGTIASSRRIFNRLDMIMSLSPQLSLCLLLG
jgi:hypothetical protein